MGRMIMDEFPEVSVDVSSKGRSQEPTELLPDVGIVSPIELYEASISEHRVRREDGLPRIPIERNPDGNKELWRFWSVSNSFVVLGR
jgi:hypothetical protein